ncbi:hypothetical protein LINGRAPRIM_LOCUS3456 [Linum grandiflorum]
MECIRTRWLKGGVGVRQVWGSYRRGGLVSTTSQWQVSEESTIRHRCKKLA